MFPPTTDPLQHMCRFDGVRLRENDSVLSIPDLEDGDTIEVFIHQDGGDGTGSTSDVLV